MFIPQQERLYAGGANTVRGYRQNELGPVVYLPDTLQVCLNPQGQCIKPAEGSSPDTVYFSSLSEPDRVTLPVGGNTVAVANLELRMPSPFFPERLQIAFFADAGQVWTRGASGAEQSFGSIKITPGIGFRVGSPVGPIRLDIGYNPYQRQPGPAYYDAAEQAGIAPLYCVSPANGLPVTGWKAKYEDGEPPAVQANSARGCPSSYSPQKRSSFLRHLTFQASIGQAF